MEFHKIENYRVYFPDFLQKTYSDFDLIDCINEVINEAQDVYAFRRHAHLNEESTFIQWFKENAKDSNDNISVIFRENGNREEIFKSCEKGELVYRLELDVDIKQMFINLFKISIRDIKQEVDQNNPIVESSLFIDDPLYDQYDFIFTSGTDVLLLTSIHDFVFIFSVEVGK